MSKDKILKDLNELSQLNGVPGHEKRVAKYISDQLQGFNLTLTKDNLGSIITQVGNNGPKIMIASHMDEIGLLVTEITKDGFLKFQTLGGWLPQVMLGQRWQVVTKDKVLTAVTGAKPPHAVLPQQRNTLVEVKSMYLDIGVASKQEAIDLGVRIGDFVVPDSQFKTMGNQNYLLSKAWDNRVGVYVVLEVLRRLSDQKDLVNQVFGTFTVMEEVGVRGAKTSSYMVAPDIAFAIDTGLADDVPSGDPNEQKLGAGPQITLYDAGLIPHRELRDFVIETAKMNNIPYQENLMIQGQTDAAAIHLAGKGAASVVINIPTRYMHSHNSIIHLDDINNTIELLMILIKKLTLEQVNKIIYD